MTEQPSMEDLRRARVTQAIRTLGYVLLDVCRSPDDRALRIVNLKADLTDEERAQLLAVVLATFPADQAEALVRECFAEAGIPVSGLSAKDAMRDARYWAKEASPSELKAYAVACADAMSKGGQKALRDWLNERLK